VNRIELAKKMRTAAGHVLRAKGYISPGEVLLAMGRLTKENYERWRFRQVPHLEKVLPGSLNEHGYFCRVVSSNLTAPAISCLRSRAAFKLQGGEGLLGR
jgi:hypothetical protein